VVRQVLGTHLAAEGHRGGALVAGDEDLAEEGISVEVRDCSGEDRGPVGRGRE
jgi:hypothetical protein